MTRITALDVVDVRFPTSRELDGSDAMNPEPDYSAAYVTLRLDDSEVAGYALLFTTGRATTSPAQRSAHWRVTSSDARFPIWSATSARSRESSPGTANCAGSARRRA